ncbi:MAG: threonylcarbamoyl-AMP synthase [Candidatus Thorarchaeota archaeon]|nr:threonylcarbamoyl-AMP synthase [Candidatus Thorarchaeota archaeon]
MKSQTIVVDSPEKQKEAIETAIELLLSGELVVYPTDTSYGLGCDPRVEDAVQKLIRTKIRAPDVGLPLLFADRAQCEEYHEFGDLEQVLARLFWPGALTLIVTAKKPMPQSVAGSRRSIAVRVPDHEVPRGIAAGLGSPVVGTSANISGGDSPFEVMTAMRQLGEAVALYIDGGPSKATMNSTIVGVEHGPPSNIRVYREGQLRVEWLTESLRVDADAHRFWTSRIVYGDM